MDSNKILFMIVLCIGIYLIKSNKSTNPDVGLTTADLIEKHGYPLEIHEVVTDDGYILSMHRIPHGKGKEGSAKGIPILLMHGIMGSGADYVHLGPGKAISFLLADHGFDVWLGNARGTTWSRKHTSLDPDQDPEFWSFSMHEIGTYDVPAKIDYILETTGSEKLHYLGFSQGSAVFLIMSSEKPEYREKVRLLSAFAPVFYQNSNKWRHHPIVTFQTYIQGFFNTFGIREVLSRDGLVAGILRNICDENSMFLSLCINSLSSIFGRNDDQLNKTLLSTIFSSQPAGISVNQGLHVLQICRHGTFVNFDFGTEKNLEIYGQETPYAYNVSSVTTPVALYYSQNDDIATLADVKRALKTLPNVVKEYLVPLEKFNHIDFVHGKDVDKLLYKTVIEEILKH